MIEDEIISNIRFLCAQTVERAQSGHPGSALGLAPLLFTLYSKFLKFDPLNETCPVRDIFLLSNGHACVIQYVMLCMIGYLEIADLKKFRQLGSKTPGHPERKVTKGVEISTGPLGQGVGNAVGFAIALKKRGLSQKVYCVFGDGCYQEGMSNEAFSLAGNLNLNNLTYIYDSNEVTIDGHTNLSMSDDVVKKFESLNFEVLVVENNLKKIEEAFEKKTKKVKLIILKTKIAEGCSKEGDPKTHGSPLGEEVIEELRNKLKNNLKKESVENFEIFENTKKYFEKIKEKKTEEIKIKLKKYEEEILKILKKGKTKTIKNSVYDEIAESHKNERNVNLATRTHFNNFLERYFDEDTMIIGSADLTPSNLTKTNKMKVISKNKFEGNYIHFGVREHAMTAISNGIASEGTFIPITATFLSFSTYAFGAIKICAMDKLKNLFVYTHDSIGLGEDGPTHQPVGELTFLRTLPNLIVIRPCDGLETKIFLRFCLNSDNPKALILSRQNAVEIEGSSVECLKGGYLVSQNFSDPKITIIATGTEVFLAIQVSKILNSKKISTNVASFPSTELFDLQEQKYKDSVLKGIIVSIEAGSVLGWYKYASLCFGVSNFGKSAKNEDVYKYFGLTSSEISDKICKKFFST